MPAVAVRALATHRSTGKRPFCHKFPAQPDPATVLTARTRLGAAGGMVAAPTWTPRHAIMAVDLLQKSIALMEKLIQHLARERLGHRAEL
jgi:hypothetical protein